MAAEIRSFSPEVSDEVLADLRSRLTATRWPERELVDDWSQGVPLAQLKALCRHWAEDYDWRYREARLARFPAYLTEIDGSDVHFLHVPSPVPDALPLIITHGWPGSIVEFLDVIGPLTDPRHMAAIRPTPSPSSAPPCPVTAGAPSRSGPAGASSTSPGRGPS